MWLNYSTVNTGELQPKLDQILRESRGDDLRVAISLLSSVRDQILRHAVEEEARLIRVAMRQAIPIREAGGDDLRLSRTPT